MRLESWYSRPIAAACALLALVMVSAAALSGARIGPNETASNFAWAVTIQHYGVDAYEMQRTVTEPLENALSAVAGRTEMRSFSEYGKSRVILYMRDSDDETYATIRDAVERVYATLPSSAQRPVINSTSEGRQPVWLAAVRADGMDREDFARVLDKGMKPAFEKLDGAGEVETYGTGMPEISVTIDPERAASLGLDPSACAQAVAASDFLGTCGVWRSGELGLAIVAYGRTPGIEALKDLRVPVGQSGTVPLSAVADVRLAEREYESLSRVDGREETILALRPGGKANLIGLSAAIAREREAWEAEGFTFSVIVDTGKELAESFRGILSAMLQGMLAVAIIIPFMARGLKSVAVAALAVPLITLLSAAAMAALGYTFDQNALSGIAIGLGTSVDAVVVAVERLKDSPRPAVAAERMSRLIPSLVGGALTSVIVLLPLMGMGYADEGIRATALSVGLIVGIAFGVGAFLAPVFLSSVHARADAAAPADRQVSAVSRPAARLGRASRPLARAARRGFARAVLWSAKRKALALAVSAAVSAAAVAILATSPMDFSGGSEGSALSVRVECEPEASIQSVDRRLTAYADALGAEPGVTTVQTTAKRGYGDVELTYDPQLIGREDVARLARSLGERVPNAFVFLSEGADPGERSYEITVSGDDDAILRELAAAAARLVRELPSVSDTVLNFKEGPQTAIIDIDHAAAARYGTDAATVADTLRRYVQGPVGHKKVLGDRELDVRFLSERSRVASVDEVLSLPILTPSGGSVPAAALATLSYEREPSRLYRKNRRNVAFFTARVRGADVAAARDGIMEVLGGMERPAGYAFEFDRSALELQERYAASRSAFILALAFIFIALAALSESLASPLAVLSILPVAMFAPVLALRLGWGGIRLSGMASLVVLSGVIVNISILIVDEARERAAPGKGSLSWLYGTVRSRVVPVAFMTLTTVAGALPLAFVRDPGAEFMKTLALATAWGAVGALVASVISLPALLSAAPSLARKQSRDTE